jgi:hypothetical protein
LPRTLRKKLPNPPEDVIEAHQDASKMGGSEANWKPYVVTYQGKQQLRDVT